MPGKRNRTLRERFMAFVKVNETTGCWEWLGARDRKGYGRFRLVSGKVIATRIMYEMHHGVEPGELCVLHRCDNPPCVNPDHLFLGTRGDNNRDAASKGRRPAGSKNARSKLTEEAVSEIRKLRRAGWRYPELQSRFPHVSKACIQHVIESKTWGHVPWPD